MWQILGDKVANGLNSTDPIPVWKAGPAQRGTFGILSNCILTLGLCIWTSLHLNIPEHNTASVQFMRKLNWMFLGLIAPELVVATALIQRNEGKNLYRAMQGILKEIPPTTQKGWFRRQITAIRKVLLGIHDELSQTCEEPSDTALPFPSRKHPWTLVHCHYAVMGGFAFDTSNLEQKIFADHRTRLTLSCNGLLELARQEVDLLPDISEEFIRDKSKANGVAKALICLQALWFCVETLGRLGQRLPISMLELNTFAHALCCVLLYFIWWDKPFNIDQPTLIPVVTYRTQKFCAAMSMLSTANMIKPLNAPFLWALLEFDRTPDRVSHMPELEHVDTQQALQQTHPTIDINLQQQQGRAHNEIVTSAGYPQNLDLSGTPTNTDQTNQAPSRPTQQPNHIQAPDGVLNTIDVPFQALNRLETCFGFSFKFIFENSLMGSLGVNDGCRIDSLSLELDPTTLNCLQLAGEAFRENYQWKPIPASHLQDDRKFHPMECVSKLGLEYLVIRSPNYLQHHGNFTATYLSFGPCAALYGSLHLLAWNGPFQTEFLSALWRISGIIIIAPTALVPLVFIFSIFDRRPGKTLSERIQDPFCDIDESCFWPAVPSFLWFQFWNALSSILVLTYMGARLTLLAESMINVAYLSDDVYRVVQWSQYIPHFGGS
ncbi:hypothetical protein B0J14DRAFT_150464 [Halenospora varia]|nr:hypothetical protein B0J14DRAFT_150464 [Halenospora varia]